MGIVNLEHGSWKARVLPEQAMNVISLTFQGEKILREPETLDQLTRDPYLYGTPLLFPPNRLKDDSFTFEGKTYKLDYEDKASGPSHIHGKLTDAPFEITEQGPDCIIGTFTCNEERYPLPAALTVEIRLLDEGLEIKHTVKNIGNDNLPFAIGFHTAFEEKEFVQASIGRAWEMDPESQLPIRLRDLTEEEKKILTGIDPKGKNLDVQCEDNGGHEAIVGKFHYTLSDNFKQWIVWNMGGKGHFICLEAESAPTNGLNMPGMYNILNPGKEEQFVMRISHA